MRIKELPKHLYQDEVFFLLGSGDLSDKHLADLTGLHHPYTRFRDEPFNDAIAMALSVALRVEPLNSKTVVAMVSLC